jgi:hypothetical protein
LRSHGVDRGGEVHRHLLVVAVELVLRLLAHGERPGQGDLRRQRGIGAQELHVAQLDRPAAADLRHHARHRRHGARARAHLAGTREVEPFERSGEAVGVALAPDLAVGDDIDAGVLHVADGEQRGVVLRLLEELGGNAPDLLHARARHDLGEHLAVHQPVGLRVAADDGGRQEVLW